MNTIAKTRTHENRNFDLRIQGRIVGNVLAVYRTPAQFHWNGLVRVHTTNGIFDYRDEKAQSSKKFIIAAEKALEAYLLENNAVLPEHREPTKEEAADRVVKLLKNDEGNVIPMSDLVHAVKLREPKVTADSLNNYDNTETEEDKVLFAD